MSSSNPLDTFKTFTRCQKVLATLFAVSAATMVTAIGLCVKEAPDQPSSGVLYTLGGSAVAILALGKSYEYTSPRGPEKKTPSPD